MEYHAAYCKKCYKSIKGLRYTCIECKDFDVCSSCELDYHSGHVIMRFAHKMTLSDKSFVNRIRNRTKKQKPFLIQGLHNEECRDCGVKNVNGFLYKCCDCGYNGCRQCEPNFGRCTTGSDHMIFRFADPLDLNKVNRDLWLKILEIRSMGIYQSKKKKTNNAESTIPGGQINPGQAVQKNVASALVLHKGVRCDVCHIEIVGCRFKCLDCNRYDLCTKCEPKNIHTGHLFVRIGKPLTTSTKRIFDKTVVAKRATFKDGFREQCANWIKILYCSICQESLREYHYKCLECHFDICTLCQRKELHMEHLMVRFHPSFNRCPTDLILFETIVERTTPKSANQICNREWKEAIESTTIPYAENRPIIPYADNRPIIPFAESRPITPYAESRPITPYAENRPNISYAANRPITPCAESRLITPYAENRPIISYAENRAITPYPESRPITPYAENWPFISYAENRAITPYPDSRAITPYAENKPIFSHPENSPIIPYAENKPITPFAENRPIFSYAENRSITPYAESRPITPYADNRRIISYAENKPITPYAANQSFIPYAENQSNNPYAEDYSFIPYAEDLSNDPNAEDYSFIPYAEDQLNNPYAENGPIIPYEANQSFIRYAENQSNDPYAEDYSFIPYAEDQLNNPYAENQSNNSYAEDQSDNPYAAKSIYDSISEPDIATSRPSTDQMLHEVIAKLIQTHHTHQTHHTQQKHYTHQTHHTHQTHKSYYGIFEEFVTPPQTPSNEKIYQTIEDFMTTVYANRAPISFKVTDDRAFKEARLNEDRALNDAMFDLMIQTFVPETQTTDPTDPPVLEEQTGRPVSKEHTVCEEIMESNMSNSTPMQELPCTMSRTNVKSKKEGKSKGRKRFKSLVDKENDGTADEKSTPNCVLCNERPSKIKILNCGHLCICDKCIDTYKKSSRQCPVCKFLIRSTHRVNC